MKNIKILVILAVLLAAAAPALAEIQLKALTLTEGKNVQITFNKTPRAPSRSSLSAELSFSKGVTTVDLSFEKLEPAILFPAISPPMSSGRSTRPEPVRTWGKYSSTAGRLLAPRNFMPPEKSWP